MNRHVLGRHILKKWGLKSSLGFPDSAGCMRMCAVQALLQTSCQTTQRLQARASRTLSADCSASLPLLTTFTTRTRGAGTLPTGVTAPGPTSTAMAQMWSCRCSTQHCKVATLDHGFMPAPEVLRPDVWLGEVIAEQVIRAHRGRHAESSHSCCICSILQTTSCSQHAKPSLSDVAGLSGKQWCVMCP